MEGNNPHNYPSGPRHIPASSPFYSASSFIIPHHPKHWFDDRWIISPTLIGGDGHPVFHTIINWTDWPASNHIASEDDLSVLDALVDYDDTLPDQISRTLDICTFQLSQYLNGYWYNPLRIATATDSLFDIVNTNPNHPSSISIKGLLLKRGEDYSRECPYVSYEAANKWENSRSAILRITLEQIAHKGAHKWFKYPSIHFY